MNANQLINMVIRMVMRRLIGRGVNKGIDMASNAMSRPKRDRIEDDRQSRSDLES